MARRRALGAAVRAEAGARLTRSPCAAPDAPAEFAALLARWRSKAAAGLPERAALDPIEIARHLAAVVLLEAQDGDYLFRPVGEEVRMRYGALRGRHLSELLSGRAPQETLAEHDACLAQGAPMLTRRAGPTADPSDGRRCRRLLLPFGDAGVARLLLAAMRFDVRARVRPALPAGRTSAMVRGRLGTRSSAG